MIMAIDRQQIERERNWLGSQTWVLIPALQLTHCVTSGKFLPLSGLSCSICKTRRLGYMTFWP